MDRQQLYQEFLQEFPLQSLKTLPLDRYTNLKKDSFCYWLETVLRNLGKISGTVAYKFGIFAHKSKPENTARHLSDGAYSWFRRLGNTSAEAYSKVREDVYQIALAASRGEFEKIESDDCSVFPNVKWKIAFLYSGGNLVPVYKKEMLETLAAHYGMTQPENASQTELNAFLIKIKGDRDIFDFYDELLGILPDKVKTADAETVESEKPTPPMHGKNYWWLVSSPKVWRISSIKPGEEQDFSLYNENGNPRRVFQNFEDARVGDIIIGYEANPVKKITAIAEISKSAEDTGGESIFIRKTRSLLDPVTYDQVRENPALSSMEFLKNRNGTLFRLTADEYEALMDMILEQNPVPKEPVKAEKYSRKQFLSEVFMDGKDYDRLARLLRSKKNIILQGAPGVGKTYSATRLAYSLMGEKDDSRISFVQFHQNYSYEDFVMGYKPNAGGGFELRSGIFYKACMQARNAPDRDYFFIIDEINRGNLSKIFGELLMLIERDYRGFEIRLAYDDEPFSVPENLYIIGMMNTADRSLAMIDYALRRRFSFFEMGPGFDTDGFKAYRKSLDDKTFDKVIEGVKALNSVIESDNSLGAGCCIGHSYFCGQKSIDKGWLSDVIDFDIAPMLREYWFDDRQKAETEIKSLEDCLK